MVKLIELKCPHCQQACDIFLTTSAYLIVLNCPRCWQPIMYHDRQCLSLDSEQIRKIEGANRESDVQEVLHNIARGASGPQSMEGPCELTRAPKISRRTLPKPAHPHCGAITGDDITNLRIELAMCDTVDDFITRM